MDPHSVKEPSSFIDKKLGFFKAVSSQQGGGGVNKTIFRGNLRANVN